MKRFALTILAAAVALTAFAATPNVQVKIQHFSATAPLDDQPVRLEAMSVAAPVAVQRGFTDENGQITFNSMPAGRYKLFLFHTPELEINIPDTSGTIQASNYVTTEGWIIATADDAGVIDLQTTQVLLLGNGLTKAGNTLQLSGDVALTGSLKLSGEDDELTIDGGELKLNGEAVGSGGETVWTNSAGIVKPAGGQALTNRLEYVSGAADNSTNVAVVVDTATTWTDGLLQSWRTGGSDAASLGAFGRIALGRNFSVWSDPTGVIPGIDAVAALEHGTEQAVVTVAATDDVGNNYWEIKMEASTNSAKIFIDDINRILFLAEPTSVSVSTAVLIADSDKTHTSGPLVQFKNNNADRFLVNFDGRIITQGGTAITPANASATGAAGTILWDSGFIYVCVSANTWKRVAIATW
jgi:hypothetical protein